MLSSGCFLFFNFSSFWCLLHLAWVYVVFTSVLLLFYSIYWLLVFIVSGVCCSKSWLMLFLLFISSKVLVVDFQVSGFYLSKSWLLLLAVVVVAAAAGCCWLLFSLISYFELLHIVVLVTICLFF